jgi:integration host factor subunit alpha
MHIETGGPAEHYLRIRPHPVACRGQEVLKYFFEEITAALKKGEPVKLNSFGKFCVRTKRERIGRNPRTGTQALIIRRKVLTFKASPTLVARINGETIDDEEQCLRPLSSLEPSRRRTAGLGQEA